MEFDEKLHLIQEIPIGQRYFAPQNKELEKKILSKFNESIYVSTEFSKYNKYGFSNTRYSYLLSTVMVYTETNKYKDKLYYNDIKAIIQHNESGRVVIIDTANKASLYYIAENFEFYCNTLQVLALSINKSIKYCMFKGIKNNIQDIFYANNPIDKLNNYIKKADVKDKPFPNEVTYVIDFESFISHNSKKNRVLYQKGVSNIVMENFVIQRIITNNETMMVVQVHNSSLDKIYIVRVIKKWITTNKTIEEVISYEKLFKDYKPVTGTVKIDYVIENNCFLYIFMDYHHFGNVFDFIYSYPGEKNCFEEDQLKSMVYQLLGIIDRVHQTGKVFMSIYPEDIYFVNFSEIIVSHLNIGKLHLINRMKNNLFTKYEYLSPEIISDKEITPGSDYWSLGIFMYECLFGVTPFQQNDNKETENMISNSATFFPTDEVKKISDECKDFILKLLDKDAKKRCMYKVTEFLEHKWLKDVNLDKSIIDKSLQPMVAANARYKQLYIENNKLYDTIKMGN